jgi:DNA-binding transcriptional MerR regulator
MAPRKKSPKGNPAARSRMMFYSRSAACGLCGVSEAELTVWEAEELLAPARLLERGDRFEPLYDDAALRRMRLIRTLADDLEVNLPGIDVILHLLEQLQR